MKEKMLPHNINIFPKILGLIGILLFFIGIIFDYPLQNIISIYVLFLSICLAWISRKNSLFLVLFIIITYANYSIVFSEYVVIKSNTLFTKYANTKVSREGIYVLLLFWSIIVLLLDNIKSFSASLYNNYWQDDVISPLSSMYVLIIDVILLLILLYGYKRPTVFGERGAPSTFYEYSIILFILCYYFGGKNNINKYITTFILLLFAAQNFIFGGRITGIQLILVCYFMNIEDKYSLKRILPLFIIFFLLFHIIGIYRGNWLRSSFSFTDILHLMRENLFTLDTSYSSFHTSMTFMLYKNKVDLNVRLSVFINFIKSIFFGHYSSSKGNLSTITRQYYVHYNGGILPFYFYFYLGWFGVFLIAIYMVGLFNKFSCILDGESGLKKCLCLYLVISTFRWYLYSPIQITRGILIFIICFLFSDLFLHRQKSRGIEI